MPNYPNDQANPAGAIPVYIAAGPLGPLGFDAVGPINVAYLISPPTGAITMLFVVTGGNARWRDDGVSPTASVGMPVLDGVPYQYAGGPAGLAQFEIIGETPGVNFSASFYGT